MLSVVAVILGVASTAALAPRADAVAPQGRFVVNGATVRDTVTQLLWQRTPRAEQANWTTAKSYCEGLSLGGLASGWRLPGYKELHSIVDRRTREPAIDEVPFPNTPSTGADRFWTGTVTAFNANAMWAVSFQDGSGMSNVEEMLNWVRCVHD